MEGKLSLSLLKGTTIDEESVILNPSLRRNQSVRQFGGSGGRSPPIRPTLLAQVSQWPTTRVEVSCLAVSTMLS